MKKILILAMVVGLLLGMLPVINAQDDVTLTVLIHQNPPMVEFMEDFNESFEEANPNIEIDMQVVNAAELSTVTQTRLAAGDLDVIDIFGFSNSVQPYMTGAEPPGWQTLVEAGQLMDLTDLDFINNYDQATLEQAGTFEGRVYAVNLGRVVYSGMFVNLDLLAEFDLEVPTTWEELVSACDILIDDGLSCMTVGGADGWPVFVGAYGLMGSLFPDQEQWVEDLWTGEAQLNDEAHLEMWNRMQVYASEMIERGASGLGHDAAPARFATGIIGFMPTGSWQASAVEDAEPDFDWAYVPFPGSSNAEDNQYLFGKYDQGWAIAENSENKDAAIAYLEAFSQPDNYQAFANAVSFIPTQPTATLEGALGEQVAPYLENFRVGYEQYWVAPTGAGQWSQPFASFFAPFNEWDDAEALANRAQEDLQAGLDNVNN